MCPKPSRCRATAYGLGTRGFAAQHRGGSGGCHLRGVIACTRLTPCPELCCSAPGLPAPHCSRRRLSRCPGCFVRVLAACSDPSEQQWFLGDVVAGGVQRYSWRSGQDVACGSGMSGRGGREGCAEACCVALRGMLSRVYSPQVPLSFCTASVGGAHPCSREAVTAPAVL